MHRFQREESLLELRNNDDEAMRETEIYRTGERAMMRAEREGKQEKFITLRKKDDGWAV